MGLFRPDRDRDSGQDPFLIWKVRLFVVGGGLGIGGMVMEMPWMVWTGVAILGTGWVLRFRTGPEAAKRQVSWPTGDEDDPLPEADSGRPDSATNPNRRRDVNHQSTDQAAG